MSGEKKWPVHGAEPFARFVVLFAFIPPVTTLPQSNTTHFINPKDSLVVAGVVKYDGKSCAGLFATRLALSTF